MTGMLAAGKILKKHSLPGLQCMAQASTYHGDQDCFGHHTLRKPPESKRILSLGKENSGLCFSYFWPYRRLYWALPCDSSRAWLATWGEASPASQHGLMKDCLVPQVAHHWAQQFSGAAQPILYWLPSLREVTFSDAILWAGTSGDFLTPTVMSAKWEKVTASCRNHHRSCLKAKYRPHFNTRGSVLN